MKNRVITISRQFGSGGRTIGKEVAAKLGIPCYDHEVIEKIAEKSGFTKEYIEKRSEDVARGSWLAGAFFSRDYSGHSTQDYVWKAQRDTILELAQKGPCVIVGRCADYLLKDEGGLPDRIYPCGYGKTGGTYCAAVWRAFRITAKAAEG